MLRTYLNQASFPLKMPFNNPLTSGAAVLKCVYYVCKACGLAPIAIRSNDGRKLRFPPFEHSKAGLLYNAVLILIILSMSAAIIQCTFVYRTKAEILKFDGVIDVTHNTMASVTAIFVLTVFCIQQRKILELANRMRVLGEMSQSLCDVEICGGRKRLLRDVMMICLTTCCTWLSIFFTTQVESYKGLLYFSYIYLCNLIITLTLMQYSIVLRLMQQILRVVNANFHHFSTEPSQRKLKVQIIETSCQGIGRFTRLRELYLSLSEVAEGFEEFYSQPMLLCIAYIFLTLIFYAHLITKPMVVGTRSVTNPQLCHCVFRIMHYVISLITLAKSVSTVITESKKTSKIFNKWLGTLDSLQLDPKLYLFSNYLLHHSLQFSVFQLFSLDGSLLMSITASITTYLVIFLQFQNHQTTDS
ncbi:gustatory receptor 34 [Nasonia vitripennis]|uniref:Gustatory receptor n=1 Tax=Nasonia vitripennis TaxID=7425 RepID=A0A7M6UDU8_NASVI|nr:gustatory receptor 34 [Nasonia vitripennis]